MKSQGQSERVAVTGLGYVGCAASACPAELGNQVIGLVSLRTAELAKYACNAFHALKIAFAVLPSNQEHLRRAIDAVLDLHIEPIGTFGLAFKQDTEKKMPHVRRLLDRYIESFLAQVRCVVLTQPPSPGLRCRIAESALPVLNLIDPQPASSGDERSYSVFGRIQLVTAGSEA